MNNLLIKLSEFLKRFDSVSADQVYSLAGRYDKITTSLHPTSQPAYKYIMYLKLMRGLDDSSFHSMKRKYINTSPQIQEECRQELNKLIMQDAKNSGFSSTEITRTFYDRLSKTPFID